MTKYFFGLEDGEYGLSTVSNRVELWNSSSGKVISNYAPLGQGRNVSALDVTADSSRLAIGAEDKQVTLFDILNSKTATVLRCLRSIFTPFIDKRPICRFYGHSSRIHAVLFMESMGNSSVPPILASGSDDTTVRLWDIYGNTSHPIQILEEATDAITALYYQATNGQFVTSSVDGKLRFYDLRRGLLEEIDFEAPITWFQYLPVTRAFIVNTLNSQLSMVYHQEATGQSDGSQGESWELLKVFNDGHKNESTWLKGCITKEEDFIFMPSEDSKIVRYSIMEDKIEEFLMPSIPLCIASHPKSNQILCSFTSGNICQYSI